MLVFYEGKWVKIEKTNIVWIPPGAILEIPGVLYSYWERWQSWMYLKHWTCLHETKDQGLLPGISTSLSTQAV